MTEIFFIIFAKLVKKVLASIFLSLIISTTASAQWSAEYFAVRGRQSLQDGQYSTAIENFNILAKLDSTDYWCYFFRGIAKYNLGDLMGARRDFDNSIRLNPIFTSGYHYRAITENRCGEYGKALEDLEKAISLRPGYSGLYFSRGITYFLARKFDDAISDFDRYIRKEPKDPSAYLNRGACLLFTKDTLKAFEDYNRAIKLDRSDPEGYLRRGRLYASQHKIPEAIADMDMAIQIDPDNIFAFFNRALIKYEAFDYNGALADLNHVLDCEPGNALTLYNRSLLYAQVGEYDKALEDMDRVLNINPKNVLARFNRACIFTQMGRWRNALADYDRAIELYPDFAKAYLNRSYVNLKLGRKKESKADYDIAQKKVKDYREKGAGALALNDTSKIYSSLLALDADFAKRDFDDEILQSRDVNIKLKKLYKFQLTRERPELNLAMSKRYKNVLLDRFLTETPSPVILSSDESSGEVSYLALAETNSLGLFIRALNELQKKQYNTAKEWLDKAIEIAGTDNNKYSNYYKAFYLLNRGVLKAEMIDFIASLEGNVQTLAMDESGTAHGRISQDYTKDYDYSEPIADLLEATKILKDIPQIHFDLGNLYCLSSELIQAIRCYDRAIELYPEMGDAYFNRALVLIFMKEREKGCIDLSRAGSLGVPEAYKAIEKYCEKEE